MPTLVCRDVEFPNLRAIFFDKDGTLANSQEYLRRLGHARSRLIDAQVPGVQEPLLMAFGLEGASLNPAGLLAIGTRYENQIAAAAYVAETGKDWATALAIAHQAFSEAETSMARKADHTPLFPGVRASLQTLAQAGLTIGIISADSTANVADFVQRYELSDIVSLAWGIDTPPGKPDPRVYLQACDHLGLSPAQTLYVGDTVVDGQMARAAQAAGFVAVDWGWTPAAALLAIADAYIDTPAQLQVA